MQVEFDDTTYRLLTDCAKHHGVSVSVYIINALRVYNDLKLKTNSGQRVYIGNNDRITHEVVIP